MDIFQWFLPNKESIIWK